MDEKQRELLEHALIGYRARLQQLSARVAEIESMLSGKKQVQPNRHRLSAAARKRIADAQKRRWAAFRKNRQK